MYQVMKQSDKLVTDEEDISFKRGLDLQREQFKAAKYANDYDSMCDGLENIKSEIRGEILKRNRKETLIIIERIIKWYRDLESKYTFNTPNGKEVVFPTNMHNRVNQNLTACYEKLVQELKILKLL